MTLYLVLIGLILVATIVIIILVKGRKGLRQKIQREKARIDLLKKNLETLRVYAHKLEALRKEERGYDERIEEADGDTQQLLDIAGDLVTRNNELQDG